MNKIINKQFRKFHNEIKLIDTEDNEPLRKKRDILLGEIRDYFDKEFKDSNEKKPTFKEFNQGSYSMGTGIKPLADDDYDIDVGLEFNFTKDEHEPLKVKKWIESALKGSRIVKIKRPCVTAQYIKGGKDKYHVDLAIYAKSSQNTEQLFLARSYESKEKGKIWENSNPKRLKKIINKKFSDSDDTQQFKRVIRYLKRWKDENFKSSGNEKPTGIALTICALEWFEVAKYYDFESSKYQYDDFTALKKLVSKIITKFKFTWFQDQNADKAEYVERLVVNIPVQPYNDLFEKLSNKQIQNLRSKLQTLQNNLDKAQKEIEPNVACTIIQKSLGKDFPIPSASETAQKSPKPVISSNRSA